MSDQRPAAIDFTIGRLTVTGLYDGILRHRTSHLLRGVSDDAMPGLLQAAQIGQELTQDVNAFLVRGDGGLILIDAGCGDGMGPENGVLARSLSRANVRLDDIDLVLLTHMHPDHIGGLLTEDSTARFVNARVLAPAADAEHFLDEKMAADASHGSRGMYERARSAVHAYAERFHVFADAAEVAPHIMAVPLPGHSPGHAGFHLASGKDTLLVWGDLVHLPTLQFSNLQVGTSFDADPALTDRTRTETLAGTAASGELVAGAHMPFPGFARVIRTDDAYAFVTPQPR